MTTQILNAEAKSFVPSFAVPALPNPESNQSKQYFSSSTSKKSTNVPKQNNKKPENMYNDWD